MNFGGFWTFEKCIFGALVQWIPVQTEKDPFKTLSNRFRMAVVVVDFDKSCLRIALAKQM